MVRLKADNELKSVMFTGKLFHTSITRFTENDAPTLLLHRRFCFPAYLAKFEARERLEPKTGGAGTEFSRVVWHVDYC